MSMFKTGSVLLLLSCQLALADDLVPGLGKALSEEEVNAVNFTVLPDGSGLPEGRGTIAEGKVLYLNHCAACHGNEGQGSINDRLVGGQGSLDSEQPIKTVGSYWPYATTVFDYIRRAMPLTTPGSLSNDELYSISAYVLYLNDIVDESFEADATTLPQVKMPNQQGFYSDFED